MCGGLAICSIETSCAFVHLKTNQQSHRCVQGPPVKTKSHLPSEAPHLDANNNALVLDELGEELATVRLLVERLVEEDHPAHAVGHAVTGGEEDVAEGAAVLLVVLHVDLLQALPHGSWRDDGGSLQRHEPPSPPSTDPKQLSSLTC